MLYFYQCHGPSGTCLDLPFMPVQSGFMIEESLSLAGVVIQSESEYTGQSIS